MTQITRHRIRRFTILQRVFHWILMLSFLIQAASGLARMYIKTPWGKSLARLFGGYESALEVHIGIGMVMLIALVVHMLYLLTKIDWSRLPGSLFSQDSLLPRPRDLVEFFQHTRWLLGLGRHPRFERWGYWEKFDYWAVFWGMTVMGITGLLIARPLAATRIIPGWGLNVAFWIHRIEGLLAMAHVFTIHFFIAHLRRHNFPMDRAMFEGSIGMTMVGTEKQAWLERLKQSGKLEEMLTEEAPAGRRIAYYLFGYAALASGIFLLVGALANAPNNIW